MSRSTAVHHVERVISIADGGAGDLGQSPEEAVSRSWRRSLVEFGLDPAGERPPEVLEFVALRERQQALGEHLELAKQEMENLYQQIAGSGFVILLTDPVGSVLASVAEPQLQSDFERAGLWLGSMWGEDREGTNGIGTCLSELRPISIHRDEHFRSRHIRLTCSAAPILDPMGRLLAVLDASSADCQDTKNSQAHTLALVRMSATVMENCYFLQAFANQWVVRFHSRPEFVGLLNEGMLAIDQGGRILAANGSATAQLEQSRRDDLVDRPLEEVLDVKLADLPIGSGGGGDTIWPTRDLRRGRRFFAQIRGPVRTRPAPDAGRAPRRGKAQSSSTPAQSRLSALAGTDPRMMHNARRAVRLADRNIALLITGETGTGKEAFARAVHESSARAAAPFVAVNCAAIPENLIESELFGYRQGAFTGARKQGMRGKLIQSSGGTLFLDEIGDMPYPLQTRLLRVLEDQTVTPLGSDQSVRVELNVISATHRDLLRLVASGTFREDLYYRLNGLTLGLPALRERADRAQLIQQILRDESEGLGNVALAPAALRAMDAYQWPGNIRQLRNALRTACALSEDGVVDIGDLPGELARSSGASGLDFETHDDQRAEQDAGALASAEKAALVHALEQSRWNVTQAARGLSISRNTLYRKLRRHGIKVSR